MKKVKYSVMVEYSSRVRKYENIEAGVLPAMISKLVRNSYYPPQQITIVKEVKKYDRSRGNH